MIRVTIPGAAYRIAREGSPGPLAAEAIAGAELVRRGRGRQAVLSMSRAQALELADYLESVAGVVGDMSGEERAGGSEHRAAALAVERIDAALAAQ